MEKLQISIIESEVLSNRAKQFSIKKDDIFEVLYNPTSMAYTREILYDTESFEQEDGGTWEDSFSKTREKSGIFARRQEYGGFGLNQLTMSILYDNTINCQMPFEHFFSIFNGLSSPIIAEKVDGVFKFVRPPILSLSWGDAHTNLHYNYCVISSIVWSYELFNSKGEVLRAVGEIVFNEAEAPKGTKYEFKELDRKVSIKYPKIAKIL